VSHPPIGALNVLKLLLINPKFPESFWSHKWAVEHFIPGKRTLNPVSYTHLTLPTIYSV